ncbi:MAG: bifunctional [glutamine synthetase] adenylyltransferase/[glutamine synthetase]-adenylyl-L-tyrosine phosphorylase, partial [Pseudomonadota bacterium]
LDPHRFADGAALIACAQTHSQYLATLIKRHADCAEALSDHAISEQIAQLVASCAALPKDLTEQALMARLRTIKTEAHLLTALGDIGGVLSLDETVGALSNLAQATLSAAFDWLLRDAARRGHITLADENRPQAGSGLVVLGMGKLGAYELNYSSDIDIVVFFEPNAASLVFDDPMDAVQVLSNMVRRLVHIMQERTADGYVFRTDIRLRPDPGAMPMAMPVDMALQYYESRGQNWERAAMIKARPVAGDMNAAERFLTQLRPFIWRKYMDYAAIADVQAIKRQIHAHKGHGEIAVHGHNIKLGRGGIREIEFFVQTQQLIAGGRAPDLRKRGTREMLKTFAEGGWIEPGVRDALDSAYAYLRRVEHAVQMRNDEQTHLVPDSDEGMEAVAALLGHPNADAFSDKLRATLETVEGHFSELFQEGETLSALHGNLVFTGETADPDTVDTLSRLGFERPKDMWQIISGWHFGRYAAVQSERARERLTELTPALLEAFAQAPQPDAAVIKFDTFIKGLPAGVQLFSMLHANTDLLRLLSRIITSAPRLSAIITDRPSVFAGLLEPAFFDRIAPAEEIDTALGGMLHDADGYEAV